MINELNLLQCFTFFCLLLLPTDLLDLKSVCWCSVLVSMIQGQTRNVGKMYVYLFTSLHIHSCIKPESILLEKEVHR